MKTYKFKATIEPAGGGGAYVLFPYDVEQEFATRSKVPIQARIAGIPYSGSLIKYGSPQHMLVILKAIRQQAGKDIGDTIDVELWKDEVPRTVDIPEHFKMLMQQAGAEDYFESLSYTHRKEYVRWITEAKTEAARQKRRSRAIEMLKQHIKTPG